MGNWNKRLRKAIIDNDVRLVQYAIEKGANVNQRDDSGLPPLYYALLQGHVNIARLLIFNGADVNTKIQGNQTPLIVALEKGFAEIACLLIQKRANVNIQGDHGRIPLNLAAKWGFIDVVYLLLQCGANVDSRNLFDAGKMPLHLACERGFVDVARLLMQYGADANATTHSKTPYELAFDNGHGNAFLKLFEHLQPVQPKISMPSQQINNSLEAASSSQSNVTETSTLPECKICLNNKADCVLIHCGHVFCLDCINQSRKKSQNCPVCRELIQFTQKLYF